MRSSSRLIERFCRDVFPLIHAQIDGGRALGTVRAILRTDRSTATGWLSGQYEKLGAATETYTASTGGGAGTGQWVHHEESAGRDAASEVVSGLILGRDDRQDEAWGIANRVIGTQGDASGLAVCIEVARVLEELFQNGEVARPRRTIRFTHPCEAFGLFRFLEHENRLRPPVAGLCIDKVGARADVCAGRLDWHDSVGASAPIVNQVGRAVISAALELENPGYRFGRRPFVSTPETLVGDPKYGLPCPRITTPPTGGADAHMGIAPRLLCEGGLRVCASAVAGYLYYLADAATPEAAELAGLETNRVLNRLRRLREASASASATAAFELERHRASINRIQRWLWGGDRRALLAKLSDHQARVSRAADSIRAAHQPHKTRAALDRRVPRRTAPLTPMLENTPGSIANRIRASGLPVWALYWADGERTLAEIAELVRGETGAAFTAKQVTDYFEAHAELGQVLLIGSKDFISRGRLVRDLKALGVRRGMDLMVHSSLSKLGPVRGGAQTVIDALVDAIGPRGTLLLPSFNQRRVWVFNPLATPTLNGAIPEAFWRRPRVRRSVHPSHSVAVLGPKAESYCRDHTEHGAFSAESPIGRLIHGGGFILSLGVSHRSTTAYHLAEVAAPCGCIDQLGDHGRVVDPGGEVREVPAMKYRTDACPVSIDRMERALDRKKLQRRGLIGQAPSILVRGLDLWRVRLSQIKNVCPGCSIKPAKRPMD